MESIIHTTIEVHTLGEVTPTLPMRQHARLKLKISIDRHQLASLILSAFDDFTTEQLNEVLNRDGIHITDTSGNNK